MVPPPDRLLYSKEDQKDDESIQRVLQVAFSMSLLKYLFQFLSRV